LANDHFSKLSTQNLKQITIILQLIVNDLFATIIVLRYFSRTNF